MSNKFRTAYEPGDVKSYNNAEYFEPGSSVTEPGQVQSIQQILARCIRGEAVPFEKGYYDNEKVTSIDEAFATMDVTQSDGFDLVDASNIIAGIQASAEAGKGEASEVSNETGLADTGLSEASAGTESAS